MKKHFSRMICLSLVAALSLSPNSLFYKNELIITAEAHQGRTDSTGGHRDNNNESGLGSYHYHCGGNPAHLHNNGICPYASGTSNTTTATYNIPPETTAIQETVASEPTQILGWQQDSMGWWYKDSDTTYKKNGRYYIDGYYYLFNADGYMLTGWQEIGDEWYYFDDSGHMVIGQYFIDGEWEYFNYDGTWDEDYYDDDYWN